MHGGYPSDLGWKHAAHQNVSFIAGPFGDRSCHAEPPRREHRSSSSPERLDPAADDPTRPILLLAVPDTHTQCRTDAPDGGRAFMASISAVDDRPVRSVDFSKVDVYRA